MTVEKSVFISYRRDGGYYTALSIFQNLRARGYDVFFDYESIASGAFDQIILNQIRARAHFLIVLHANTLIKCNQPGDWVRREIETAMDEKRNIIPVTFEDFDWKAAQPYLAGKLSTLGGYNALKVPEGYFDAAMDKLVSRFLNIPLEGVIHPTPSAERAVVQERIETAAAAPQVTEKQLTAQEWVAKATEKWENKDYDGAIGDCDEAIRVDSNFSPAYNHRGVVRRAKGDFDGAIADYSEAIRINPKYATAYNNRGIARKAKGDHDGAIADYDEAIRIDPKYVTAYSNRGNALYSIGDYDGAIADYDEAIRIDPEYAKAYFNRGIAREDKGDYEGTISDYTEAIRLNPKDALAYFNRGWARLSKNDVDGAITDYDEAIRLDPKDADAYYNRSVARRKKGDRKGADADLAEARRLGYKG